MKAAPRKSSRGTRTCSEPSALIRRAQEAATAMNNQLSKTICFIGGVGGTSAYAICGWRSRSPSLSSRARRIAAGRSALSGSRRRTRPGRCALG